MKVCMCVCVCVYVRRPAAGPGRRTHTTYHPKIWRGLLISPGLAPGLAPSQGATQNAGPQGYLPY